MDETGAPAASDTAGQVSPQPRERAQGGAPGAPALLVRGTVVSVQDDHLLVDIGAKADGILPAAEAVLGPGQTLQEAFQRGQEIEVAVQGEDPEEGTPQLSMKAAAKEVAWRRLQEAHAAGEPVEAAVRRVVTGGLLLDAGVRAFMPASQVERGSVQHLEVYVGQSLRAKIVGLDHERQRVVLSRRALLEEELAARAAALWAELAEGQIRTGTVKALTDFGAFIDLGGVDGLLHVSAMSWGRVEHPSDLLSPGQELRVKILRLEPEVGKVSLGLKQVQGDPWERAEERYPVDAVVEGTVMRIRPFGAFVQLEPGVEGLVHISQLADRHVKDPGEVVREGERVRVRVLRVTPSDRRIALSLREAEPASAGGASVGPHGAVTLGDVVGGVLQRALPQAGGPADAQAPSPGKMTHG